MEAEPWEALDLDDSDIPHLLRPCKRRRSASPTTTAASAANPISQSPSFQSLEEHSPQQLQRQSPPCTSRRCTIPGPAGSVQSAMLLKDIDRQNQSFSNHQVDTGEDFNSNHQSDGVISTQDYIRRAMEDTAEFDDDFTRQPWISALQFLGAEDGVVKSTPISSIKKCLNGDKVVQVVAVIKSCTLNGLGGMIVSLKDPTGTVGASVHQKVLSHSEFGKNLTIGSVLILREVAVFAPVMHLLGRRLIALPIRNDVVTLVMEAPLESAVLGCNKLVQLFESFLVLVGYMILHIITVSHPLTTLKVFCQNGASTSKPNNSACPIQYADPGIENCSKAKTMEKMSTMQNVTTKDIETTQHVRKTENSQNRSVIQRQNLQSQAQRGLIDLSQDACNEMPQHINRSMITGDHQEFVKGSDNLEGSLDDTNNMNKSVTRNSSQENQGTNAVQIQRQPLKSKASLPEWTDDQLDELFAGDEDDGY
ncbi:hypothetical protein DH2020_013603 [Rehmannia glutinosa]|uniref:Homologous recombination OB-fold protein OB-fold domain-containing protein n=1 Tax=Rehmannia glutinosa TaxID=99300 RepID=A0ABR0X627_REHGL